MTNECQLPNAQPKVFCIGWIPAVAAVDLWHPSAPKNCTKPETIAEKIQEILGKAPLLPYVGRPADIVVVDDKGEVVLDHASPAAFLEFADAHGKFSSMKPWEEAPNPSAVFVSFNTKELFVSCAAVLWREGDVKVPRRFWRNPPGLVEIYETLVPGELRNGFWYEDLLTFAGSDFVDQELMAAVQVTVSQGGQTDTAAQRAQVVWSLANFAQLL